MSNLIEIIINASDNASEVVSGVVDRVSGMVEGLGRNLVSIGAGLAIMTAPAIGAFTDATNHAVAFEESMVNVQSIIKTTDDETAALADQILALGENSRFGPQMVADSYYDIVGAVADADSHMAIMQASIQTAQAGNAELGDVVKALTSTMNSYGFAADKTSYVQDVLTQVVARGVGTMGDFAGALPQVTGLANSVGIAFDDLGAMTAWLTTQGNSASQSTTQLASMMTTLLSPTAAMADSIEALGYESGKAMLEALGLPGAYQAIADQAGGLEGIVTNTEALRGATALLNEDANAFLENFDNGMAGLTEATEAIQMESAAAQMDLFNSSIETLKIEVGQALLPALNQMLETVRPIISDVIAWAKENPALIATIAGVVAGVGALGTGMAMLGGFMLAIAPMIPVVGTAFGVLLGPLGLVAAAAVGLYIAFEENLFGIGDALRVVAKQVQTGLQFFKNAIKWFIDDVKNFGIADAILGAFGLGESGIAAGGQSWLEGVLVNFGMARDTAESIISTIGPRVEGMFTAISEALSATSEAFTTVLLPDIMAAMQAIIPIVQDFAAIFINDVLPFLGDLLVAEIALGLDAITFMANAWTNVLLPALVAAYTYFTDTLIPMFQAELPGAIQRASDFWNNTLYPALQAVGNFITGTVIPAVQDIATWLQTNIPIAVQTASDFWNNTLRPAMSAAAGFITDTLIPNLSSLGTFLLVTLPAAIDEVVSDISDALTPAFTILSDFATTTLLPALTTLYDYFNNYLPVGIALVNTAINTILVVALAAISDFWTNTLQPSLQSLYDFLQVFIPGAINVLQSAWDTVLMPALEVVSTFIATTVVLAFQSIYDFLQVFIPNAIDAAGDAWNNVLLPALTAVSDFWTNTLQPIFQSVYDYLLQYIPTAIDTAGTALSTLLDGFTTAATNIDNFINGTLAALATGWDGIKLAIEAVGGAISTVIGGFNDMINLIPDELIPGSPTPFEMGIRGISDAMNQLAGQTMTTGAAFAPVTTGMTEMVPQSGAPSQKIEIRIENMVLGQGVPKEQANEFADELEKALRSKGGGLAGSSSS